MNPVKALEMTDSERRQLMLEVNPWWRHPTRWEESDQDLRDARLNALRHYDPSPLEGITAPGLILFMGPRRSGKSVAVKRTICRLIAAGTDPLAIAFCPCETLRAQDLRRIIKLTEDLTPNVPAGQRYWFFDEITSVPQWAKGLKQLRDQTILRQACVVATGSSTGDLREARGELGGREGESGEVRVLLPMGFRPFVREMYPQLYADLPSESFAPTDLQSDAARHYLGRLGPSVDDATLAWERYLSVGGFPRAVADIATGAIDVAPQTANGLWNILVGDVLRVGAMSDRDVKALLSALARSLCSPLNVSNLTDELDIGDRKTAKDRVDRICASLYAWRASVSHNGTTRVKAGQDKLYFIDPLIARLPSIRDHRIRPLHISKLSEQQIGTSLTRVIARHHLPAVLDEEAVLVRRNPDSGAEIDFVGDLVGTPIESKYVSQGWRAETDALQAHYGHGIVAKHDILDLRDHIWAMPAALLAWMINDA